MHPSFDPGVRWVRSAGVVLRPEPFGALAYDFSSRRLSFLKSRRLVTVVEALDGSGSVHDALDVAGVDDAERPRYVRALADLAASGMIRTAS